MSIKVGRITYVRREKVYPILQGYQSIVVLTKRSKYGDLGPYCLKNDKEQIMENVWQFSKVYENVPDVCKAQNDGTIIWKYPAEIHISNNEITPEYFNWREKGMNNKYYIRYPVGREHRHKCKFAIKENNIEEKQIRLNYIEARKELYFPLYTELVEKQKKYKELKTLLKCGENLLIIEIDGPHQESLAYYKKLYNVDNNFITDNTIEVTPENMKIMLNDAKHPFGHGYCLGMSLLNIQID